MTIAEQLNRLFIHPVGQLYALQSDDGTQYFSQKTAELTSSDVERHINGDITVAVKPLQQRTQVTKFVCIDFDADNGQPLSQLYEFGLKIAAAFFAYNLPVYVEFSGRRGFHLWLFFATPITGEFARKIAYGICATVDFVPNEIYPADDYMQDDGKGEGGKGIKLPCGIHRATKKRTGFLIADTSWNEEGCPNAPENQAETMAEFEQVSTETLLKALALISESTTSNAKQSQSSDNQHVDVDFSSLGQGNHPACIQYLTERGAPLDQEYNEANITLCRYALSRGLDEETALMLATQMAQNTSPQHKTSKTAAAKVANFQSVWKTVETNPDDYPWSCGYILGSQEIMDSKICPRWNCPYWSYERSQNSVNWKGSEADYAVERAILASVLYNTEAVDKATLLDVPAIGFISEAELGKDKTKVKLHRMIWEAILLLVNAGKEISPTSLLAAIGRQIKADCQMDALIYMDYLRMVDPCQPDTLQEYLQRVKDTGLRITSQQQIKEAINALQNREIPLAATLDATIDHAKHLQRSSAVDIKPISCYAGELVENLFGQPVRSISTQSAHLNHILNGGWHAGKLYVIGAPPASGKTTFCSWCTDHAATVGFPVLYVPFEMSREELWINSLARIGGINSALIEGKQWMDDTYSDAERLFHEVQEAIRNFHNTVGDRLTIYEAGPEVATAQLKGNIAKVRQQANLNDDDLLLVVVDYLQLMPSGDAQLDAGTNETARVGKIATALKQLARDTNTAVIAISDITKQAYQEAVKSGNLDMGALRDSFKIAHAADVVMLLQSGDITTDAGTKSQLDLVIDRLEDNNLQVTNRLMRVWEDYPLNIAAKSTYARLSILKNRGGTCGESLFVYEKAYHRFIPIVMDQVTHATNAIWQEADGSALLPDGTSTSNVDQ